MPDAEDWYNFRPSSQFESLKDHAELAARLGSPLFYDRRGDYYWSDSFDHGIGNWSEVVNGAGGGIALVAGNTEHGGYAARMTAAAGAGNYVKMQHYFILPSARNYGISLSWRPVSTFDYLHFYLVYYDVDISYNAHVRLNKDDHIIEIEAPESTYNAVADVGVINVDNPIWYPIKLVVDYNANTYLRLFFGYDEYDVSAYDLWVGGGVPSPSLRLSIENWASAGSDEVIDVDHVILTVNEPD